MEEGARLTLQPDPSRYTLPCFLEDVSKRFGPRVAIEGEARQLSFEGLEREARAFAKGLIAATRRCSAAAMPTDTKKPLRSWLTRRSRSKSCVGETKRADDPLGLMRLASCGALIH